ncbi:unnamed protein product, partial [marine sediment metagenome]
MHDQKTTMRKTIIVAWSLFFLIAGFTLATLLDRASTLTAQTGPVFPGAPGSFSHLAKKASPSVVNIS